MASIPLAELTRMKNELLEHASFLVDVRGRVSSWQHYTTCFPTHPHRREHGYTPTFAPCCVLLQAAKIAEAISTVHTNAATAHAKLIDVHAAAIKKEGADVAAMDADRDRLAKEVRDGGLL